MKIIRFVYLVQDIDTIEDLKQAELIFEAYISDNNPDI